MNIVEVLRRVPLFKALDASAIQRMADMTHVEGYEPEDDIVEIGDPGRSLFVVLEGDVQVLYPARSADFELARLGPGDFFGEMAVLNDKPRSATVRAVGHVRVAALDKSDFRQMIMDTPAVAVQLLEDLSIRLRNTDEQISGLSDKAMRDALTGLLNRRAFHDRIVEECDRARRYGDEFSLILADLDKFKSINDGFGHDVGDGVLAWVGRILLEHTRAADAPFRVGGEEFAILCPSTPADLAEHVSRRLVETISEARPPLDFDLHVTMSAGFATCPTHGRRSEQLYQVADRALLRAKSAGRNQVLRPEEGPLPDVSVQGIFPPG
ncbi:MAG TPA: GGDEF domain-containing protein [Longimicrobiales bacterium]|jgi:diguanylate cyclase (GGDEF)-like protein